MKKIIVSIVFIPVSFAYCGGSLLLPERSKEILAKSPQIALLATGGFSIVPDDNLNKRKEQLKGEEKTSKKVEYALGKKFFDKKKNAFIVWKGPNKEIEVEYLRDPLNDSLISLTYSSHALERLKERRISKEDVEHTIKHGEKKFSDKKHKWTYVCKMHDKVIKVIAVKKNKIPRVVTAIKPDSLRSAWSSTLRAAVAMSSRDSKINVGNANSSSSSLHNNLTKAEESERERVLTTFKADLSKVHSKKMDDESVISAVNPKTGTIKIIFPNKEKFVLQVNRIAEDHATRFPAGFTYDPKVLARKHKKITDDEKKHEALDFIMKKFGVINVIKNDKGQESFRLVLPARDAKQSISGTIVYKYIKVPSNNNNNTAGEEFILIKSSFRKIFPKKSKLKRSKILYCRKK